MQGKSRINRRKGQRLRKALRAVHLWLGLTLGLVWALQGLTGAMLVFHRELDRAALAPSVSGSSQLAPRLPVDRLLAAARKKLPGPPESIGLIDGDPSLLAVNYVDPSGDRRALIIDTASGQALRDRAWRPDRPTDGNQTRWIYELHHRLLLGESGGVLLGLSGLFLAVGAGWGMYLAWPIGRQWGQVFVPGRLRTLRQRLWGWHRATGLVAGFMLIILALSGASMDFGKPLRDFSAAYLPYRPAFEPKPDRLHERQVTPQ